MVYRCFKHWIYSFRSLFLEILEIFWDMKHTGNGIFLTGTGTLPDAHGGSTGGGKLLGCDVLVEMIRGSSDL